ncbi:conserved unknown protein [Ectocarpus siliculosus]|uniref:Uncharacterized protein n=1 Tax=Ectocarpus siliculosus TaxID=2880 RepID=D7FWC8_ECTSI|nr:conserved unknown protein [Ectocarpus siliculosus]|eukprot:CBJ32016.1 conserved unknown protein [Ectocarpus siliculosus]
MASEDRPGDIQRQQSNWADEIKQRDHPTTRDDETAGTSANAEGQAGGGELSDLIRTVSTIESQVGSLEEAMDPRGSLTELAGAYGRQGYESLGSMLGQARTATSEVAERVQASGGSAAEMVVGGRPLTRTATLEDVINEADEREEVHRRQQQQQDAAESGGGRGFGDGGDDSAMREARPANDERGIPGVADGGGFGGDHPGGRHSETLSTMTAATATEGQGSDGGTVALASPMEVEASATSAGAPQDQVAGEGGVGVFSFGRGDLGALLHSDDADHSAKEGPVVVKNHRSVLQVSTSLFHTMAVTASGEILGCGQNDEGQVRPDLLTEAFLPRPSLVEPVLSHRITQVACGLYHTVCATASGMAMSWGGNESGQLGHSGEITRTVRPMVVQVTGAGQSWSSRRRASRVACGDLFTLILTSRAEYFRAVLYPFGVIPHVYWVSISTLFRTLSSFIPLVFIPLSSLSPHLST